MLLPWILIIFFGGGLLAWLSGRLGPLWPRWTSMVILIGHLGMLFYVWARHMRTIELTAAGPWFIEYQQAWIPQWGVRFHLGLDGISLLLIVLSNLLAIMAVATSWNVIRERIGFFHFNLLWILAALAGIFLSVDLLLFYFFWEMLLVPLYFLIAIWGYEARRTYAALKFFIFTQAGGLFLLLGILGLYFIHGSSTGIYTFSYADLLGTRVPEPTAFWLMLCFFVAFAVKLPMVPLHTWLPDAHSEAPTAGSVDLAGLVLKVGAYGILRFTIPLFPQVSFEFAPAAMALGVAGILYGAIMAFSQTDLKRLVAYTSISHMGFVLLGLYAWNQLALQGVIIIMLSHGISAASLFILVGDLYERIHTRDLSVMGGFWSRMPRMGGFAMVFALASLGLPGLGNFVGEFLVLVGTWRVNAPLTAVAATGLIASVVYSLWIMQKVFQGSREESAPRFGKLYDSTGRETAILGSMVMVILFLGLYPSTVMNTSARALEGLRRIAPRPPAMQATAAEKPSPPGVQK